MAGLKFRAEALKQISSPDRLDMAMQVVKPVGWLAVVVCGLILAAAGVWAWFGTYRVTVQGEGLVHVEDGVFIDVFSPKEGWLEYLAPIGQEVESGQLIARLHAPEHSRAVDDLTGKLDLLTDQRAASQGRYTTLIDRARSPDLLGLENQRDQALEILDRKIQEAKAQIGTAQLALELATQIYSQDPGRVVMAPVSPHSLVPAGKRLLTIESGGSGLEVLAYLPAAQGKNVRLGMSVRVSPTNVRREEFGSMLGRIVWVSPLPQSQAELSNTLANEDLSRQFMKDGPPIAVKIALVPDLATASGYRWTSTKAAGIGLSSGSLVKVWVTVREDRPMALVIPALQQSLGL